MICKDRGPEQLWAGDSRRSARHHRTVCWEFDKRLPKKGSKQRHTFAIRYGPNTLASYEIEIVRRTQVLAFGRP